MVLRVGVGVQRGGEAQRLYAERRGLQVSGGSQLTHTEICSCLLQACLSLLHLAHELSIKSNITESWSSPSTCGMFSSKGNLTLSQRDPCPPQLCTRFQPWFP